MTLFSVDTGELLPLVIIDCLYFQYEATVHVVQKLHSYEASIIYFSTSKKGKIKELEKLLQKYTIFTGVSNISYKILC